MPLLASAFPATGSPDSNTDADIGGSVLQVVPLIVPGKDVAAHTDIAKRQSNAPPAVQFSDIANDTPGKDKIPSNFIETKALDDKWSTPVCKILTAFKPEANGDARNFYYNVQGAHKHLISIVHDGKLLNLAATFITNDVTQLVRYDLMDLCKNAFHQAAQSNHELKFGPFNLNTIYSALRNHQISIQQVGTAGKRSTFGAPIGIINIQIGDKADGVELFNVKGLPA